MAKRQRMMAITGALFALTLLFAWGAGPTGAAEAIKWGVLIDLSGPTSDWGKNQIKGQLDAMRWVNEHGGINGKELKLIVIDDGYKVPRGVAGYNRLVDSEKVIGLYIQSTGTTLTLELPQTLRISLAKSYQEQLSELQTW